LIQYLLISIVVCVLSFLGGIWLWKQLSSAITVKKINIIVGASILFLMCFLVSFLLAEQILYSNTPDKELIYFLLILNLSILYNLGYLLSIHPDRKNKPEFTNIFNKEILLLPLFLSILLLLSCNRYNEESYTVYKIFFILLGLLSYLSGFSIWEKLRNNSIFGNEIFRNILWKLSFGFVAVCVSILFIGILSFKFPWLITISWFAIFLVFISLTSYCVGLLYALIK